MGSTSFQIKRVILIVLKIKILDISKLPISIKKNSKLLIKIVDEALEKNQHNLPFYINYIILTTSVLDLTSVLLFDVLEESLAIYLTIFEYIATHKPLKKNLIYYFVNLKNKKGYLGSSGDISIILKYNLLQVHLNNNIVIQRAINKYGPKNFAVIILEELDENTNLDTLKAIKQSYFSILNPKYPYVSKK